MKLEPAKSMLADGLWHNNPGLVQLLGLCPLLAISNTVINALGLGLATTLTLLISSVTISSIRHVVPVEVRIPTFVLVISTAVTVIEMALQAWFFQLYSVLGIFVPLIVVNCVIIGRAEAFASKNTVPASAMDALAMGVGFTLVLVTLGGMREALGFGTLLADAQHLFGEQARGITVILAQDYRGLLLAILPPGAFIGLGLLLAGKNILDARPSRARAKAGMLSSNSDGAATDTAAGP